MREGDRILAIDGLDGGQSELPADSDHATQRAKGAVKVVVKAFVMMRSAYSPYGVASSLHHKSMPPLWLMIA